LFGKTGNAVAAFGHDPLCGIGEFARTRPGRTPADNEDTPVDKSAGVYFFADLGQDARLISEKECRPMRHLWSLFARPEGKHKVQPPVHADLPWWRSYPRTSRTPAREPWFLKPDFKPGDLVRLRGRPQVKRRILDVEWHWYCHQYCYYVETSTSRAGVYCPAYWFAHQLVKA
jgi:hypothetical protein